MKSDSESGLLVTLSNKGLYFLKYICSRDLRDHKIIRAIIVVAPAAKSRPPHVARPIAATVHSPEAVVRPRIAPCFRNRIVPAPMKPIPLIT